MNLGEMRDRFRTVTGDRKAPYFWANDRVDSLINEAYVETVDRGLVIFDRETFSIDVDPGVREYLLDKQIIRVKEAAVTSRNGVELDIPERMCLAVRKDNVYSSEWSSPNGFVIDEDGLLILAYIPAESATIALAVYRYPDLLESDTDTPVIPEMYHAKMLSWAYKIALLDNDADAFSQTDSDRHDAEFTRTFGFPKTAQDHRQRRRNTARSIKTPSY